MNDIQQEGFQIGTLIVAVVTVIVVLCYGLIFLNPQVALNPFKPRPTATATVAGLPPTWTPTPTNTRTPTFTPTRTSTPTFTPLPTATPTDTPIPPTATATRRVPTRTPRPPTVAPSPYTYRPVFQKCEHSGGTFIEGTVWRSSAGDPEPGVRVAFSASPGGGDVYYVTSGSWSGKSPGYYVHVIKPNGASPGTFYVWVADGSGNPLSDPHAGRVTTNSLGENDPASCWLAVVDFVRR